VHPLEVCYLNQAGCVVSGRDAVSSGGGCTTDFVFAGNFIFILQILTGLS